MKRFEKGFRRVAFVLAGACTVYMLLWGLAPGTGLVLSLISISFLVTLVLLAAEAILFVIRGFASRE